MFNQLTWFIGIVSIIQIAFLPGFIICRAFKLEHYLPSKWAAYFFSSLLVNYLLVLGLCSLHLYTSIVLRSLVGIEVLVALMLAWPGLLLKPSAQANFLRFKAYWQKGINSQWIAVIALLVLMAYGFALIANQGGVFMRWDPLVSYNPWAIEWAANHFPAQTYDYPQVLSTNWSLSYVLIGQLNGGLPLEFFPRAIMGLFPFFTMLMLWNKMLSEQSDSYGLSLIILGVLIAVLLPSYIGHGYADIPVMAISFAAVLILVDASQRPVSIKRLLCGSALCATAALTKQAGLWLVLVYPLLSYLLVLKPLRLAKLTIFNILSLQILVLSLITLSWYGLVWWGPLHQPIEWSFLTKGIYVGASWSERLGWAWQKSGALFWIGFAVACLSCKSANKWRLPFIFVAMPMVAIWLFGFSYDDRNLAMSLPFMALMLGEVLYLLSKLNPCQHYLAYLKRCLEGWFYIQIVADCLIYVLSCCWLKKGLSRLTILGWLALSLFVIGLMGWQSGFRANDLNAYQVEAKQAAGETALYQMLNSYQAKQGFNGTMLTAWGFLFNGIPGLSTTVQALKPQFYGSDMLPNVTQSSALFLQALQAYPEARYILVDNDLELSSAEFHRYLDRAASAGKIKRVGRSPKFSLYEIIKPLQ
ncbi:MAG: hypothetical protein Q7V63_08305 [Gammaproteobacteria bacterium]|nr:hypothetical protein [Gammaproteobacteria bacterium]